MCCAGAGIFTMIRNPLINCLTTTSVQVRIYLLCYFYSLILIHIYLLTDNWVSGNAVCGAPKRRFRPYAPAVNRNANETDVRKARKAELQRDEAIG